MSSRNRLTLSRLEQWANDLYNESLSITKEVPISSAMDLRRDRLETKAAFLILFLVTGDVPCVSIHASIADRSKEFPSGSTTGSFITECVMGHRKESGTGRPSVPTVVERLSGWGPLLVEAVMLINFLLRAGTVSFNGLELSLVLCMTIMENLDKSRAEMVG